MAARRSRRFLRLLVILLILFVAAGFGFRRAYPGMTSGMLNQLRYATFAESRSLFAANFYWLEFMQKLSFDPRRGMWTFDGVREEGLSDFDRGLLEFHRGKLAQALPLLERSLKAEGESEERLFWLAMTEMRLAEATNCLAKMRQEGPAGLAGHAAHGHGLFCVLPLVRPHEDRELSRRAMRHWTRLLDRYDPDDRLYRWLLNFSAMTIQEFPQGVPPRYRIATPFIDAFYGETARRTRAKYSWLHFTDHARELGAENFGAGRGVAAEDFDRDGDLDLVVTGTGFSVRYLRNEGGKRFTDVTGEVGLSGLMQPFTVTQADYDNDGWMDLMVARPYDHYDLFRNRGGRFENVTAASGLLDAKGADELAASWITAWGDVDNDGDLDLFVANWAFKMPFLSGIMARPRMDSKLFVNDGNGHFHDGNAELGLQPVLHDRYFIGADFGDYDGDGFADLFLSSPLRGTSVLLHNEGGRRFTVSPAYTRTEPGFVGAFLDADQDGRLDLFHAGFGDARTTVVQAVFGEHREEYKTNHSSILLQTPGGRFVEHNEFFGGGAMPASTMGAAFGDLDNDGCYDFYLGTTNPEPWFIFPNLMYIGLAENGRCTGRMDNVSMLQGFGNVQKGHGIVFFDFDGDGDQDIYSCLGGMWPGDQWVSQLFVNESDVHNAWVKIRLRGRKTNFYGAGARLKVTAHAADGRPIVRYRQMDDGTGFGSSPYLAHVGLMNAVAIDGVEVYWPVSRCRKTYPAELRSLNVLDEARCLAERPAGQTAP
ncbi:MAG TPA: CRTAC1 family protein [Thermoanaerobaculia bacterium]